ncbi:MAG TPA: mechanosensitive ion channel domain-containing protein [Rhizomicrobium sp.]|nr:mechanosensitive ion channel domain-containing protein [Rhizomicrobium sp.]
MNQIGHYLGSMRPLTWPHIFAIVAIVLASIVLIRIVLPRAYEVAEQAPSKRRLRILRTKPLVRLLVWIVAIAAIVPILVEPTLDDVLGLIAWAAIVLAFALKDYVTCVIAGFVTVLENTYQIGDWVELAGVYGEVRALGIRAVHIVTSEDNEAVIPNSMVWSSRVLNSSSGRASMLCVTNFYLDPDHDGETVRAMLLEIGEASSYRKAETAVKVSARETPWGSHYKLFVRARDSREQFAMNTDLTICAKERLRAMGVGFSRAGYADTRTT